jgi:hypothetical protein
VSAESVIYQGRIFEERQMTDMCVVGVETPGDVLNEETGQYEPSFTATYTGSCRFKAGTTAAGEIDAAGQLLVEKDAVLKLPVTTSGGVKKDMVVKITASLTDPALVGTTARIKGPAVGSYTTARRFSVEVTS